VRVLRTPRSTGIPRVRAGVEPAVGAVAGDREDGEDDDGSEDGDHAVLLRMWQVHG
jgi:hypothetical protein